MTSTEGGCALTTDLTASTNAVATLGFSGPLIRALVRSPRPRVFNRRETSLRHTPRDGQSNLPVYKGLRFRHVHRHHGLSDPDPDSAPLKKKVQLRYFDPSKTAAMAKGGDLVILTLPTDQLRGIVPRIHATRVVRCKLICRPFGHSLDPLHSHTTIISAGNLEPAHYQPKALS